MVCLQFGVAAVPKLSNVFPVLHSYFQGLFIRFIFLFLGMTEFFYRRMLCHSILRKCVTALQSHQRRVRHTDEFFLVLLDRTEIPGGSGK